MKGYFNLQEKMNDTFMDDCLAEEKEGFRHTNEGIVVPVFDEDGTTILPSSWNDGDDEIWEALLF